MPWNQWQLSSGMGGNLALESVAGLVWNTHGDTNLVNFNFRFPGQYYDQESGLHYNGARYYNPGTGRYLESEPIGVNGLIDIHQMLLRLGVARQNAPSLNTYAYVYSNPANLLDPDGLVPRDSIEGAVMQAVLRGNKQELDFLLRNVVGGKISPAKKLLLRKQCERNARKIKEGTLDVRDAEKQFFESLQRQQRIADRKQAKDSFIEKLSDFLRDINDFLE